MKTIEITDEMYNSLMELSKEINNQGHRATQMPYFFQIQTTEEVPAAEGCGYTAWYMDGTMLYDHNDVNEVIKDNSEILSDKDIKNMTNDDKDIFLEELGYKEVNYDYEKKYQNAFFTAKACKAHIKMNDYHYRKPVDYLNPAWRNSEMELVMKFLCELTGGKLHK